MQFHCLTRDGSRCISTSRITAFAAAAAAADVIANAPRHGSHFTTSQIPTAPMSLEIRRVLHDSTRLADFAAICLVSITSTG